MPGHLRMTEGFTGTSFIHVWGVNFWADFLMSAGGEGQGEALGCRWRLFRFEGNCCVVRSVTVAGVVIFGNSLVAMECGKETRADPCGGAGIMASNALSIWVILASSFLESAIKLRRAWEFCVMVSSRCCVSWKLGNAMVSRQSIWGQGASSFSDVGAGCWWEEGSGGGMRA